MTQTGISVQGGQRFVAIRYIGKQPFHRDTVLNRPNLRWKHEGDVQWVPEVDGATYIRYTDIWEFASDVEEPAGGIIGLGTAGTPARAAPSDPHSQGLKPIALDQRTPAPYETDSKAENPVANAVAEYAELEKITADIAQRRITEICLAIPKLRPDEFSPDSKPKCDGLKRVLGRVVLTSERDAAWALIRATMQKQAKDAEFAPPPPASTEPDPGMPVVAATTAPPAVDDPIP